MVSFLLSCFFLWEEDSLFVAFQEKKENFIVFLLCFLVRELCFCVCVSGLVLFQMLLFHFSKWWDFAQIGEAFRHFLWNLVWIDWIFGWFCWLQFWCHWLSSVVGTHKMNIVNLFMRRLLFLKVFFSQLSQVWTFFVFTFSLNVLWSLCFAYWIGRKPSSKSKSSLLVDSLYTFWKLGNVA